MSICEKESIDSSVFYSRKMLDYRTHLECSVFRIPLGEFHRASYGFSLSLSRGGVCTLEVIHDVTCDKEEAERIFDRISAGSLFPCHLLDVICDSIGGLFDDSSADHRII